MTFISLYFGILNAFFHTPSLITVSLVKVLEKEREVLEEKLRQQSVQSSLSDGKQLTEIRELKIKVNALEAKVADYDERLKLSQEIVNKLSKEKSTPKRSGRNKSNSRGFWNSPMRT